MRIYNATIRLIGGENLILTEVTKEVSAAELVLLRTIHGPEAVVNIKPIRQDKRPHREERDRLKMAYGDAKVDALFKDARLPVEVDLGDVDAEDDILPDPVEAPAVPERTPLSLGQVKKAA